MRDHRVVLFERAKHGSQIRVGFLDRREEGPVFASVVAVERSAEPVAVQEQVAADVLDVAATAECLLRDAHGVAEASVNAS